MAKNRGGKQSGYSNSGKRGGSSYSGNRGGNTGNGSSRGKAWLSLLVLAIAVIAYLVAGSDWMSGQLGHEGDNTISLDTIPEYSNEAYVEINGNVPEFTEEEITTESYESYSPLDGLGRCGTAMACIGKDLMPKGERNRISSIHPSGWHTDHYDFVDQGMLFNRCHLIAYQLAGEDLNDKNLITGTRYLNTIGMLPFEEAVGNWVRRTGNHVMYRVSPIFVGRELVARGVHMEALSVEDGGKAISYNIYCYNVQPGVEIDYATGDNWLAEDSAE